MDRSLSEQGLLEAPSYLSLPAVPEGASEAVSNVGSTAHQMAVPLPTAPPPPPSTNPALMQLQPQNLSEQSHYALYPQQQLAASASTVAGVCVGGGVNIGQLDPLSAHRDSVMPGRSFLWPSVFFCSIKIFLICSFVALFAETLFTYIVKGLLSINLCVYASV